MQIHEVIPEESQGRFTSWREKMLAYEVIPEGPQGRFTSWREKMQIHEVIPEESQGNLLREWAQRFRHGFSVLPGVAKICFHRMTVGTDIKL